MKDKRAASAVPAAFCGMAAALETALMFLTGLVPVATYSLPALAGFVGIVIVIELGVKWAWPVYAASSILSVLTSPDKEAAALYVLFFGCYPILKALVERIRSKAGEWLVKFAIFNAAAVVYYFISIYVLGVPQESFWEFGILLPAVLLVIGNVVFALYDYVVSGLVRVYWQRLHRPVSRMLWQHW